MFDYRLTTTLSNTTISNTSFVKLFTKPVSCAPRNCLTLDSIPSHSEHLYIAFGTFGSPFFLNRWKTFLQHGHIQILVRSNTRMKYRCRKQSIVNIIPIHSPVVILNTENTIATIKTSCSFA